MSYSTLIYEEKQFLGQNRFGRIIRLIFSMLCFLAYYWSENPNPVKVLIIKIGSYPIQHIPHSGTVFFWLGCFIMILSILFNFIYNIHIQIYSDRIFIKGMLTAKQVTVHIKDIKSVKVKSFRSILFKNIKFNLRRRNRYNFYTYGKQLIEIELYNNTLFRIGSPNAKHIQKIIRELINLN